MSATSKITALLKPAGMAAILAAGVMALSFTGSAIAQSTDAADGTDTTESAAPSETTPVPAMRIANGTRFGAWTVNCEALAVNETACVLSQRLVRTSDNVFLAELLAFWSGDGSKSYLAVRVPNGVYFPSGFAMKPADAEEQTAFIWQSCSRDVCEGLLELGLDEIATLESAEELIAGYRPSLRSEPLVFRLGMTGAGEGLEALKASMEGGDSQ